MPSSLEEFLPYRVLTAQTRQLVVERVAEALNLGFVVLHEDGPLCFFAPDGTNFWLQVVIDPNRVGLYDCDMGSCSCSFGTIGDARRRAFCEQVSEKISSQGYLVHGHIRQAESGLVLQDLVHLAR
jgi:hypothetical protein